MKSIRLSLIVYFLMLSTAALGTVSWLSYRFSEQALLDRQADSQDRIRNQSTAASHQVRAELDRRLVSQARAVAGHHLKTLNYEAVHAATVISSGAFPAGCLQAPLWLPQLPLKGNPPPGGVWVPVWLAERFVGNPAKRDPLRDSSIYYPKYTHIDFSEKLVAGPAVGMPQEYYQIYGIDRGEFKPWQRSESMGDVWFTLDAEYRNRSSLFKEEFDEAELTPGLRVRRVTMRTPVSGFEGVIFWPPWRPPPGNPKGGKQPPPPPPAPRPVDTKNIVIQYAIDMEPMLKQIRELEEARDNQLANLENSSQQSLRDLQKDMIWVNVGMLVALWLGGFLVIHLGLAPLTQMSEAVSQVSVKDFHLPLDIDALPKELQPIALRLSELLEHLQKAFAREKQAAADISHELRTPLAALMTTLEVGLKKDRSPEEYRELLLECLGSGKHMYELVERLLTLARLDAGVVQYRATETDVVELALDCSDLIRPLARANGLELRLHLPDDPIATLTDATKLREVLINLLHNAVQYNKPAGAIDLTIDRTPTHVRIEVRDTGIGISPDALPHIFERFYRADPSRHADTPHAGLGLAIAKSFVDLMGGTIHVESSAAGAAFIVEIPLREPKPRTSSAVTEKPVLAQK
ncbi:MAG: hypothetical protein HYR84_09875 [Planctomycetes bacterium]|nr:hypothetical protein [Planctomycetota bacterium]